MFKNFRHRAQNFIDRMANNPAEASRAVFASLLIIGICSLSLDFGKQVFPESFEARLLDPLDRATLETAQDLDDANNDPEEKLKLIDACKTARADNDYGTFLDNFENSFAGILPGAGNLLLEHPSTVSDRREKLIFEVMKNYAELKFCIPSDQFKVIYLADYRNVFGELNFFFQVFLYEEDSSEYPIDEISDVFIDTAMREYILVEKDLISTQKYVTEVIDRAIESAIELDRWTEQRLNNLTAKTNNKLTIGSNVLIEVSNDIANENVKVNSANGFLLEQINKILASIQPYPVSSGGAGVPSERGYGVKYEGDIYEAETYVPGPDGTEAKASILMSFGLLNLIDETNLDNFLNERFGKDLALYVAALNHIDPFVPGGSINYTTTVDKTTIAPHLCSSIDSTGQDCYSGTLDTSQIADSTSITKASDSAEASGIESDGGNPAGTDITTTSAPMITSYDKAVVPDELTPIPIGLKNADTNGNIIYTDLPDVIPIRPIKGSDITDDAFELSDDEVIIPSWNYDLDPIDVDIISCPTN